jgi:DNA-directed RNA polymerase subunit M/transcription elongation factor TFIIS
MIHTGPVSGDFPDEQKKSNRPCPKCGADELYYQLWESSCGGFEDYCYECCACGKTWWVEGPDS